MEGRFERQAAVYASADNGNGEAGRNSYLYKFACSLNARSVPEADALTIICEENETVCRPPLPEREARKCVESAYANPGGFSPEVAARCGDAVADGRAGRISSGQVGGMAPRLIDGVDLSGVELPEPPDLTRAEQLHAQFSSMFRPGELANVITESAGTEPRGAGQMVPASSVADPDAAEVLLSLADGDAGAWVRCNPTDGDHESHGKKAECDADVTRFGNVLVESDPDAAEMDAGQLVEAKREQLRRIVALRLPCACVVDSGHKSVHAVVRVEDPGEVLSRAEWERRRDLVYAVCDANGLPHDPACKNPSRLTRLAGAVRGESEQTLLATGIGAATFAEWAAWIREAGEESGYRPSVPGPVRFSSWQEDPPRLAPVLIEGFLREGALAYLNGGSKSFKTWMALNLAVSICAGADFLGHSCERGRVLYLDFEMQKGSLYKRIGEIVRYRSGFLNAPDYEAACGENLYPWSLRDYVAPLDELERDVVHYARAMAEAQGQPAEGFFKLIVIDPLYMVEMGDENSATDMAALFRVVRRIQRRLGSACLLVHHHPKGAAGAKDAIDRGAGSGAIGRNGDALLDVSPLFLDEEHQQLLNERYRRYDIGENALAYRVEGVVRDFPRFRSIDVVWTYPVHTVASTGDRLGECSLRGADMRAEANAKSRDAGSRRHEAIARATRQALSDCLAAGEEPTKATVYDAATWGEGTGDINYKQFERFFEAKNRDWFPFRSTHSAGNTWIVEEIE